VPVFIYNEDNTCTFFSVPPNRTLNEVRLEALGKLGFAEHTESFRIFHMETGVDGTTIETRVDPNTPVDLFFPHPTNASSKASSPKTSSPKPTSPKSSSPTIEEPNPIPPSSPSQFTHPSAPTPLKLRMRRKSAVRWNVRVQVEKKGGGGEKVIRNVVVDSTTKVQDVLDFLFMVEAIEREESEEWTLWKEVENADDLPKPVRLIPTETPFQIGDRTTRYVCRRMAIKRAAKISSVLGIPTNINVTALLSTQAQIAEDVKRKKDAYRSAKLTKVLGITSSSAVRDDEGGSGGEEGAMPFPPRERRAPMGNGLGLGLEDLSVMDLPTDGGDGEIRRENEEEEDDISTHARSITPSAKSTTSLSSSPGRPITGSSATILVSRSTNLDKNPSELSAQKSGGRWNEREEGEHFYGARKESLLMIRSSASTDSFKHLMLAGGKTNPLPRRPSLSSITSLATTSTTDSILSPETAAPPTSREPAKRTTGKLADFFGVKRGQKEMEEIQQIVVKSKKEQKTSIILPDEKTSFIARIYFGNLTYTSISVPIIEGTVEHAKKQILDKLGINESSDQYIILEYQQLPSGIVERELQDDERMYDVMFRWQKKEIFLFRKKSTKNLLRHQPVEADTSSDLQNESLLSLELPTAISTTTLTSSSNKRVAKLAGFFGVESDAAGANRGRTSYQDRDRNQRMEVAELCKMLNVMSQDAEAGKVPVGGVKAGKTSNFYKEGWLSQYIDTKKFWQPSWCKLENQTLTLRPTTSRDEAQAIHPSQPQFWQTTIPLSNSVVEIAPYALFKRPAFQVVDAAGRKHSFAAVGMGEVEEWVAVIRNAVESGMGRKEVAIPAAVGAIKPDITRPAPTSTTTEATPTPTTGGKMSIADFDVHKVLGRGKFGKVLLCSQKSTGKVYAVKVLNKSETDEDASRKESQILRSVQHPFIVGLHYAFQSPERLYLVMEYVNGGELYFHVANFGRFTEERVRFYGAEIVLAVDYLHSKEVVYRDLKLENILLDKDGHVKITDFGLSKQEDVSDSSDEVSVVGTLEYLAPEVLQGLDNSYAADWWAYGVVIFEMLCGIHPFMSDDRDMIRENIISAPIQYPHFVRPDARDMLSKLLRRNPAKRLGCGVGKGKAIMEHPFYASVDFGRLVRKEIGPPFKPELTDDFDVSFFDEIFTTEDPSAETPDGSLPEMPPVFSREVQGFSFMGNMDSVINEAARGQSAFSP